MCIRDRGYRITNGWSRVNYIYFAISFSQPVTRYGYTDREKVNYPGGFRRFNTAENFPEIGGRKVVSYFEFKEGSAPLEIKVALSAVGTDGAVKNLHCLLYTSANEHIEAATDVSLSVDRYRHTIHIDFAVPVSRASLTFVSLTGKAIRNYSITGQQTTLPIGSIPAGIYIVKIVYNNKLYTQKALF